MPHGRRTPTEIRDAAQAMRTQMRRMLDARGAALHYADVLSTSPLIVSVHHTDHVLNEADGDVTLGLGVRSRTLAVGDALVVAWVPDGDSHGGDWHVLDVVSEASVVATGRTLSARDYGAAGDGVTDDTAAIQAALNACAPGDIVFLPAGVYATTAPLVIPPQVSLEGTKGNRVSYKAAEGTGTASQSKLKPKASFSGTGVLRMLDMEEGGYAAESVGQRIYNLTIDGSSLAAGSGVAGLRATGRVREVMLERVAFEYLPHNGLVAAPYTRTNATTYYPYSWYVVSCVARTCGNYGLSVGQMTDSTFLNCQAIGCTVSGWFIANAANSTFVSCRSEWNGQYGFHITSAWGTGQGSGGASFVGCSTDRNTQDGFRIDSTGNGPLLLSGITCRRDGRNVDNGGGGGYAGIRGNAATQPIVIDGLTVYPGVDDDGVGTASPQYGVSFNGCTAVTVDHAWLHAASTAWHDGGTNALLRRGPTVVARTGSTSAPSAAAMLEPLPSVPVLTAAGAANNTLFRDSADNALKWRDNAGTLLQLAPVTPQAGRPVVHGPYTAAGATLTSLGAETTVTQNHNIANVADAAKLIVSGYLYDGSYAAYASWRASVTTTQVSIVFAHVGPSQNVTPNLRFFITQFA